MDLLLVHLSFSITQMKIDDDKCLRNKKTFLQILMYKDVHVKQFCICVFILSNT